MVRFARESDFDFVKSTWQDIFDDPKKFVDWNFKENYSAGNTIIAEYDGIAAANMQLIPYTLVVDGRSHDAIYISGVATLPKYRGRGLMSSMLNFCEKHMKANGIDYAFLLPANNGLRKMYEKFGFKTVSQKQTYKIIPCCDFRDFKRITSINCKNISAMSEIYNLQMSSRKLYAKRDSRRWKLILDDLLNISGGEVLIKENSYILLGGGDIQEIMGETPGGVISGETQPYAMLWNNLSDYNFFDNINQNYFNLLF